MPQISHQAWVPTTNAPLEVRLQVKDRAGNPGEALITVNTPAPAGRPQPAPVARDSDVTLVNNKRINLHFEVKDIGKSGVGTIQLWYTRDGHKWQKYSETPKAQSPYLFEAPEEGLYGFTFVAVSGVGVVGEEPPHENDPPQVWVEVDLTKPVVQLLNVDIGRGPDTGTLTITWTATDKHLGRQPITLSYTEKLDGSWTTIVSNMENTGRYVWRMPESVPFQFYLRVEATDRAGNVGTAETPKPVAVDLSQPKVRNVKIEPAGK